MKDEVLCLPLNLANKNMVWMFVYYEEYIRHSIPDGSWVMDSVKKRKTFKSIDEMVPPFEGDIVGFSGVSGVSGIVDELCEGETESKIMEGE